MDMSGKMPSITVPEERTRATYLHSDNGLNQQGELDVILPPTITYYVSWPRTPTYNARLEQFQFPIKREHLNDPILWYFGEIACSIFGKHNFMVVGDFGLSSSGVSLPPSP